MYNTDQKCPKQHLLFKERSETMTQKKSDLETYIKIFNTLTKMNLAHLEITNIVAGPRLFNCIVHPEKSAKISSVSKATADVNTLCQPMKNSTDLVFGFPRTDAKPITLTALLKDKIWAETTAKLPLLLGVDTFGEPQITDLTKVPHLLISGRTGAGKTMFLKSIIKTLQPKAKNCKFTVFDPKLIDFKPSKNVVVINDATQAFDELDKIVSEVETQYKSKKPTKNDYHILMFDEFADFVALDCKRFEAAIQALTQKARACGIHLIMATQRPDAITKTLRANLPVRLVFQTRSKADSVRALGEPGAELLLGWADALYSEAGCIPKRMHTPII